MINGINLNNTQNNIGFKNNPKSPIYFSSQKDEFVRSKEMPQSDEKDTANAIEFLSGVDFEQLASKLIKNDNWNNGSDIVGFNKRKGNVVSVMLDLYNFQDGENKQMTLPNIEFLSILEQVKNSCLKQNPDKKDLFESLYIELSKILK